MVNNKNNIAIAESFGENTKRRPLSGWPHGRGSPQFTRTKFTFFVIIIFVQQYHSMIFLLNLVYILFTDMKLKCPRIVYPDAN